ncbi:radical SAM protein, TatD family-associated [Methanosarcina thermophila]|jgi:cyclic pyranopterin phosphate synthase|uniref:Metallo cofactor biosynthesis protein n=3 Tax=Methanosarcina thermophila TaxID=2210 RepID=A0A1I6Y4B4_METTE|nr:TatD family nuclease-associated radical SAM protein [Methanosarcina thermophila]ALK05851.1 MAG: metallo cofactor biosynthesis protein [Methanosarcina sp. 795]AKB12631.1 radical SAM domain protein [Methanosarcina thermophila TM-1]AKB16717.1 radical SAM domain protein [Methanosarcina thermophila CHTI-55]NLU57664.1 radical SAM protein [Methanosarcina thermophila]SFT44954.1 radical SAM protein, TatD family-associated [Methanosarcina thermophila]
MVIRNVRNFDHMDTIYYEAHKNLYLNLTNRCSADCVFCIRNFADGVYGYNLRLSKEPTTEEVIEALKGLDLSKYREIVFTGLGEPTLRFDTVLAITRWLKSQNIRVRLDTNGQAALINPRRDVISELKSAGIDSISVSLNAESEEKYNKLCRPVHKNAYGAVLDFIRGAKQAGINTRVTVVEVSEIDIEECRKLAKELDVDFHVRALSKAASKDLKTARDPDI